MGIVASFGLVFDVSSGDSDAALALLGSFIDGAVFEVVGKTFLCLAFGDGCCEGCLHTVVSGFDGVAHLLR